MRFAIIFVLLVILSVGIFIYFSYIGEVFLGIATSALLLAWPVGFWLFNNVIDRKKINEQRPTEQDIVEEDQNAAPAVEKVEMSAVDVSRINREIDKLHKAGKILDEEKEQGILSSEAYSELKIQNRNSVEKLEQEIGKATGKIERKIYCRKGKHYIDPRDCIPSKVEGYLICQEHNEEIRVG
jgi:hypothetical protein